MIGDQKNVFASCISICSDPDNEPPHGGHRTPLIIIELHMSHDIETPAPKSMRRNAQRPPLLCRNLQRSQSTDVCHCKVNRSPEFIVCGKEIDDSSHASQKPDESSPGQPGNEHGGFGIAADPANCIDCCACFVEMERRAQQMATQLDERRKLSVNVDNFFMDSYGNLPKTAEIVDESADEPSGGVCATTVSSGRACSPNTSRVIRITLNNKSGADGKK